MCDSFHYRRKQLLRGSLLLLAVAVPPTSCANAQALTDAEGDEASLHYELTADDLASYQDGELPAEEIAAAPLDEVDDILSMDIDRLANTQVNVNPQTSITLNEGTLTATTTKTITPSTVTRINRAMITNSGARNLNELLDIFVPNLQIIRHNAYYSHVGIRGIVSDREDKYLLRVNGRIMNQRFVAGADNERDLPLLRDILSVDVIRGQGSTTYGPGAISGVINITTFDGTTFEGLDAMARQGFEQYMTTGEVRWGRSFAEDHKMFLYYGYADQDGADASASPLIFGSSGALPDAYPPYVAGTPAPFGYPNDEASLHGSPKHKLHFQYTYDTFDFWTRYTFGSYLNPQTTRNVFRPPVGTSSASAILETRPGSGADYQQLTFFASKIWELSEDFQLSAIASYDFYDFVETRLNSTTTILPTREEEIYLRIMGLYTPNDTHALAVGYEHSREMFGLDTPLTTFPARGQRLGIITEPWSTNTGSVFGEYRVKLLDPLTAILSGRMDKHTYSDELFSPRVSVLYDVSDIDVVKFNIGQSVRRQGDEELRFEFINEGTIAEEEVIRSTEVRWQRRPTEHWMLGTSIFHQNHDVVGFSGSLGQSTVLGNFESWGAEVEAVYVKDNNYFTASQSYTKLLHSSLVNPTAIQGISAMPYGFGDDFANWSPNLTKFAVARDVTPYSNVSTSMRVYWDFPGAEDLADYNRTLASPSGSIAQSDVGYAKAWRGNYYWDWGYQQRWSDHFTWRVDLYNVLGWVDKDLNKRNFINRLDSYRPEAAAIGISAIFEQ